MCGRFQLSVKGKQISERFNVEVFDEMYKPTYNSAPSQNLPVITNSEPGQLSLFKWGLIPFWAKDPRIGNKLINTRAETITEKPAFKNALVKRRCLVPANGFYEWRKSDKTPFRIFLKTTELFAMAGIWETWKDAEGKPINSFSIITTTPNSLMEKLHNRMPVILATENEAAWLNENDVDTLKKLLIPFDSDKMDAYPVSTKVNSPANNNEEIIQQIDVIGGQQSIF
ncbi:MAG TPA: SOS response-associated peptidase [Bacteroidales bacterium]